MSSNKGNVTQLEADYQTDPDPEVISRYLAQNPDFFADRKDLLMQMHVYVEQDETMSLSMYQLSAMRERIADLLENSANNDRLFAGTRKLVLQLIAEPGVTELVNCLQREFHKHFNIDAVGFLLFGNPLPGLESLRFESLSGCREQAPVFVDMTKMLCNRLRPREARFLFARDDISSAAVLPISCIGHSGLLGVGSRNPEHFHSGMDSLFLEFITRVVESRLDAMYAQQR